MNPLVPALVSVLGVGGVMGLVAGLRRVPVPTGAPKTSRAVSWSPGSWRLWPGWWSLCCRAG